MGTKKIFDLGALKFKSYVSLAADATEAFKNLDAAAKKLADVFSAQEWELLHKAMAQGNDVYPYPGLECPLCFHLLTVDTGYDASTGGLFGSKVVSGQKIAWTRLTCANCRFAVVYLVNGEVRFHHCPDEPEPERMRELEAWAQGHVR